MSRLETELRQGENEMSAGAVATRQMNATVLGKKVLENSEQ